MTQRSAIVQRLPALVFSKCPAILSGIRTEKDAVPLSRPPSTARKLFILKVPLLLSQRILFNLYKAFSLSDYSKDDTKFSDRTNQLP